MAVSAKTPPRIHGIPDQTLRYRAQCLWEAAGRAMLAVDLIGRLADMADHGQTLGAEARRTVTTCYQELCLLPRLLDELAARPSPYRPNVVPPAGRAFPAQELEHVTTGICRILERDLGLLEVAGVVPTWRRRRGRALWHGLSFRPRQTQARTGPSPLPASSAPDLRLLCRPYHSRLARLLDLVRVYRVRLECAPLEMLPVLTSPAPSATRVPPLTPRARETTVARELARAPHLTSAALAEILGCDASTVRQTAAWKAGRPGRGGAVSRPTRIGTERGYEEAALARHADRKAAEHPGPDHADDPDEQRAATDKDAEMARLVEEQDRDRRSDTRRRSRRD